MVQDFIKLSNKSFDLIAFIYIITIFLIIFSTTMNMIVINCHYVLIYVVINGKLLEKRTYLTCDRILLINISYFVISFNINDIFVLNDKILKTILKEKIRLY